jgi:DNA-directed RNA polymerase specialized sigma24 family protein
MTSVVATLEGECEFLGANLQSEERILQLVREAISSLPPRFQEFIVLDLVERREPQEIRKKMKISSESYFRKIKCEAFFALRAALSSLIQKGIDSLF